jgi:hypothetical protein
MPRIKTNLFLPQRAQRHFSVKLILSVLTISIFSIGIISGCSPSKETKEETETTETKTETIYEEQSGSIIMQAAKAEQDNPMYSKETDSTYLYWLNNKLILLSGGQTKCNIYALNTLFRAGFKTPDVNVLTRDLMDTTRFNDILPVVGTSDPDLARKGDLISWYGHVIIFDELVKIKNDLYALAWWAGTRQADNGDNIINNVVYGKYKLRGHYVIRRPVKD